MTPSGTPWGRYLDLIYGRPLKSPVEWPVNASGDEKPVDDGGAIARADQVDVVRVGGRVVLRHPRDQLQDEADVVSLGYKDI